MLTSNQLFGFAVTIDNFLLSITALGEPYRKTMLFNGEKHNNLSPTADRIIPSVPSKGRS